MNTVTLSSIDRLDIIEAVTGMGFYADTKNWDALSSRYDDVIRLDYLSLFPEAQPFELKHAELHDFFRESLEYWDVTQHLLSNTQITLNDDGTVMTRSHARASHWKGGHVYVFSGIYSLAFRKTQSGWKIFSQRLDVLFEEDDPHLVKKIWLDSKAGVSTIWEDTMQSVCSEPS